MSAATRQYYLQLKSLQIYKGILFRMFTKHDGTGTFAQMLVPQAVKDVLLYHAHEGRLSGHLGREKTQGCILQTFYWYGVRQDCNLWVNKCDTCAAIKKPPKTAQVPLGEMPVGKPLDQLATDILGPLPKTSCGNIYIMVVTIHFTKWAEIFPLENQKATTCADVLLNEVIAWYGCPLSLHSDQGWNLESKVFAEICNLLGIHKTQTSPGNPRCNGQTERFNQMLMRMVKSYLRGETTEWDHHLGCLSGAYCSAQHDSMGMTPNLLMLEQKVQTPTEVMFGEHEHESYKTYSDYVWEMKKWMQHAHDVAWKHLGKSAQRQKELYDQRVQTNLYEPGDLGWLERDLGQQNILPKLWVPYEAPYMVYKCVGTLDYDLFMGKKKHWIVHHNRLKPYHGSCRPTGFHHTHQEALWEGSWGLTP